MHVDSDLEVHSGSPFLNPLTSQRNWH